MNTQRIIWVLLLAFISWAVAMPLLAQNAGDKVVVNLTPEERAFLTDKQLRLGVDYSLPPFEFIDEHGVYSGISAEFMQICARRLGLRTVLVTSPNVSASIEKMKAGEIDVIPKIAYSPERTSDVLFTEAHVSFVAVIVTRQDARYINGIDDLEGLRAAVLQGLIVEASLKRDFPHLPLISLPNARTALLELCAGKIDAYIENLAIASYNIDKLGMHNLKLVQTSYNFDVCFGVRKDWPLLASIFNKALASLSKQERYAVTSHWLTVEYQSGFDWKLYGPLIAALLAVIASLSFYTRSLRRIIQEREHSEKKINAMGEAMADALIMIDEHGKVRFWNPAAVKMFGYTAQEAIGMDFHEIATKPEIREVASAGIRRFAATGHGVLFGTLRQATAINRAGQTFPVEVSLAPFHWDYRWFAVGTVRDISARKRTEDALKESEERSRLLLHCAAEGIFGVNASGQISFINLAALTMLGFSEGELLGQEIHYIIHHSRPDGSAYPVEQCLMYSCYTKGLETYVADEVLWRKDGTNFPVEYSCKPIVKECKIIGAVVTFQDISKRKQVEKEIKEHTEELERFSHLTINREEKMIQLKQEINTLLEQIGKEKKYKIVE